MSAASASLTHGFRSSATDRCIVRRRTFGGAAMAERRREERGRARQSASWRRPHKETIAAVAVHDTVHVARGTDHRLPDSAASPARGRLTERLHDCRPLPSPPPSPPTGREMCESWRTPPPRGSRVPGWRDRGRGSRLRRSERASRHGPARSGSRSSGSSRRSSTTISFARRPSIVGM